MVIFFLRDGDMTQSYNFLVVIILMVVILLRKIKEKNRIHLQGLGYTRTSMEGPADGDF